MTATLWFLVGLAALTTASVLSAIYLSLRSVSRSRAVEAAEKKSETRRNRVELIISQSNRHAAAIALPLVAARLVVVVSAIMWFAAIFERAVPNWIDFAAGIAAASLDIWLFAIVLPQAISEHVDARTVAVFSRPIRAWSTLVRPLLPISAFVDEVVRRLAGTPDSPEITKADAELLSAVEESESEGQIDRVERDMIEAVVEFRSTTVEQVMTPRTEIEAIAYTDDLSEVQRLVDDYGHSRVPVYEDNLDNIRGILYAKDLLRWIINHGSNGKTFVLAEILRDATFVPETKTVRELLHELLASRVHIAMVADEYGGTSGLVTFEDIVEEIFGEIRDEYEEPEADEPGVELHPGDGSAILDARAHIDDVNGELIHIGVALPEADDYDTVGGYITVTLGRIPDAGENIRLNGASIDVLEAEPTRVVRVRVRQADHEEEHVEEASGEG